MIDVSVPNNVVEYKSKFAFGLTGRQVLCVGVALVLIILDYVFLKPYLGDLVLVLAVIPAFLAACFGFGEKFTPGNITFEKYLSYMLFPALLAPRSRKMRTDKASFVVPCDKYYKPIPDSMVSAEVLACVQQVREAHGIATEEDGVGTQGAQKMVQRKYRKSKQALL